MSARTPNFSVTQSPCVEVYVTQSGLILLDLAEFDKLSAQFEQGVMFLHTTTIDGSEIIIERAKIDAITAMYDDAIERANQRAVREFYRTEALIPKSLDL
jgi:hypothetical protein